MARASIGGFSPGGSGAPKYKEPGIYRPALYDTRKIAGYQQEAMAPGLSQLRRALQGVQARRYGSPTERGVAVREAIRGYGEALAPLQAGASQEAMQRYAPEYEQTIMAEQQRLTSEREKNILEYQQALADYNRRLQEEADAKMMEQQTALQGTAQTPAIPLTKTQKGWGMDAPQTIVKVGGRTYTMPANYSVEGLSEASRRNLSPGYSGTPSQAPQSPENIQSFNPNWWTGG